MKEDIYFEYLCQPPKRWTFEQPKLRKFVERWCKGKVLNLFAGKVKLDVDEFRVDIDKNAIADWYGDAYEFVTTTDMKFDTVILDPPYNIRKSREKYEGRWIGSLTKIKNALPQILNEKARVISLGYDSVGMSKKRGFRKIAICLVCHSGDHNDTICLVEEMNDKKYIHNPVTGKKYEVVERSSKYKGDMVGGLWKKRRCKEDD